MSYDPALPIAAWHGEITQAIADHQVVIVAGETGSGKTTQLPKMCLDLGRQSIGHTQPRRIAARTVAERIAEELHTTIGDLVGYQVRFTRKASKTTRLKVMTDGVLLAEIRHDRDLRRYDTIILDEAHERSLNIDFLLGYLKSLLPRRPDLKIVITSATIDTERFAAHFSPSDGIGAPIIEVSGRTFPVEVRYRPLLADGEADQVGGIIDAIRELSGLGAGDILVFLSGEREIRDAADAIVALKLSSTEVLPLYARLSAAEQHRVFAPHAGRRIVLATNVAETSLTVPGIRYVIDTGLARISRYSARTKVQRLPIEPISKASANQRAGRCGRVAPGTCIRLYSEEDFAGRPEFTEPEILRTNLASVILQMTAAELGDIATFPFVDAPDNSQIKDGLRLLTELGAISEAASRTRPRLTTIGRRLAALPIDPRLGRMLLAAERHGCLREMLIIVSGLSIQDPRERPAEQRDKADALHRRFWGQRSELVDNRPSTRTGRLPGSGVVEEPSDFLALLRLWDYLRESQKTLSGNGFRRLCRDEFLHFLRIREWQDLHTQLKEITRELGLRRNGSPAPPDRIHTAVLTGLLSHVGLADLREERKQVNWSEAAGPARVSRRTRHAVRDQPGVQRGEGPAAARHGCGDCGNHTAVGPYGGRHPCRADRGGRPASAAAAILRATLVSQQRFSVRVRNSDLVRRADRLRPPGRIRQDQSRRGAGDLSQIGSRGRPMAYPPPVLLAQRADSGRSRIAGRAHPPPRPGRGRPGDLFLLRRQGAERRGVGRALRFLVEPGTAGSARPAHHDAGRPADRSRGGRRPVLSRDVGGGRSVAHDQLRFRARERPRRCKRDHSGRGAQPGSRRAVQLAGARAARRARHGAHPVAAQGQTEAVCSRPRHRAPGARLARRPSRRPVGVPAGGVGQGAADAHR